MVFRIEKSITEKKEYKKTSLNYKEELQREYKKFENKYYALFNNSMNGIAVHKLIYDTNRKPINYIITEVNQQYEKILKVKKEDVLNKFATDAYKVTKPPYLDIYSKVAETQNSCSFETYFQPMDKHFRISVISPKKGEFMTVFADITEKKKLTESEDKYKLITENANDLICILNKNYKYEYINEKTYLNVLGYSKIDLIGKSALKLNHPDDFKNFISSFWGKKEIDDRTIELRVKHKKGKWVWLNINIQRFLDEKNEKKFLLVSREITFRKLAEKKIRESEEKYRHLFEDSPFTIALMDFEGKILECNSYMKQLLGFNKEELTGQNFRLLSLVPESSLPQVLNGFKRLSKGDIPKPKRIQLFKKDGTLIWVLLHTSIINLQDQKFLQVIVENITEMKKAEDRLRESEARFRALVETTSDWIWEIDENGYFTYSSPKVKDLLGFEPNEVIGRNPLDFMALDHYKNLEEAYKNLFFAQKPYSGLINRCKHKNGTIFQLETSGVPIFDENGKFCGFRGIDRDITKRIQIEQKLRESEENYRELVNDANSIILRWDTEGKINFINEFGETFFGYSNSGLIGKHVIGTIVPKTETTGRDLVTLMEDICKDPELYKNNVNENITKYGRKVWISWTNKAIKDEQGKIIGILSVGNDITKQRLATLKISESEDKFRTITEQSFIGIAIIKDLKFKYVNQQFSDTLGYTPKEILKWEPKEFFQLIHPEDRERITKIAKTNYYGNNEVLADLQFRVIKKTGEVIWLEIISKKVSFEGKSADLIATLDVTEKKEAERIILEENRKLLELNKMRKDIITRVSHELKTPLTSIYGASQILLKHNDGKIDENMSGFVEILHRGALRLKKLVENLIDASRIESGKLELSLQMNDIVKITKECVEEMTYLLESRKINVILNFPDELQFIVDKIRLQQVITNILSNAIKNTPAYGKIYINLIDYHDHIDIQIKDTGIGITRKEKELLFEKFGKMERYGKDLGVDIEGSGLGLFISKEIVELHGGQIIVDSEGRNKGSTFTIRLF